MKYSKQTIPAPRHLKASWTIEPAEDYDIESTLYEDIGKHLSDAIDEEIIKTIEIEHLVNKEGWIKVELPRFYDMMHAVDINEWVDNNCGLHTRLGSTYVFKEAEDATWFRMRWISG